MPRPKCARIVFRDATTGEVVGMRTVCHVAVLLRREARLCAAVCRRRAPEPVAPEVLEAERAAEAARPLPAAIEAVEERVEDAEEQLPEEVSFAPEGEVPVRYRPSEEEMRESPETVAAVHKAMPDIGRMLHSKGELYHILGVKKTASQTEVSAAHRRLVLLFHPDKLPQDAPKDWRDLYSEFFQTAHEVYQVLREPESRAAYDREFYEAKERARRAHVRAVMSATGAGPEMQRYWTSVDPSFWEQWRVLEPQLVPGSRLEPRALAGSVFGAELRSARWRVRLPEVGERDVDLLIVESLAQTHAALSPAMAFVGELLEKTERENWHLLLRGVREPLFWMLKRRYAQLHFGVDRDALSLWTLSEDADFVAELAQ